MERDDTRRGQSGDGMKHIQDLGFRELRSLRATVTVQCPDHGSHSNTLQGPWRWVLDLMGLFREISAEQGRWVVTEYQPTDEVLEKWVGEWDGGNCT